MYVVVMEVLFVEEVADWLVADLLPRVMRRRLRLRDLQAEAEELLRFEAVDEVAEVDGEERHRILLYQLQRIFPHFRLPKLLRWSKRATLTPTHLLHLRRQLRLRLRRSK
jgi:hypothetical protein